MARVIYGGGVTEFEGSIGGTTYQSNGSGFIVRNKPVYRKRKSITQIKQIKLLVYWSQYYRNLSPSDKATWQYYADNYTFLDFWGRTKSMNGLQWFLVFTGAYYALNSGFRDTPFTYVAPIVSNPFTITYNPTSLDLNTAGDFSTNLDVLRLYFSTPTLLQSPVKRKLLLVGNGYIVGNTSTFDMTTIFEAATGLNYVNDVYNTGLKVQVALTNISLNTYIPSTLVFAT